MSPVSTPEESDSSFEGWTHTEIIGDEEQRVRRMWFLVTLEEKDDKEEDEVDREERERQFLERALGYGDEMKWVVEDQEQQEAPVSEEAGGHDIEDIEALVRISRGRGGQPIWRKEPIAPCTYCKPG